jgi:formate/nitrite transporter FocA (FNT family)
LQPHFPVLFAAAAAAHTGIFKQPVMDALFEISRPNVEPGIGLMFMRAIFAGWLIALMVWLLPTVEGARPLIIIIIITYMVAHSGFSHLIAGSVDCAYLLAIGKATLGDFFRRFFLPTFAGNVVGASLSSRS